tara:strand:+ start:612 stop:791 length:180 start_codon:yes stop_codon:yes gene_type:complete
MGKFNFGGDKPLFAGVIIFIIIAGLLLSKTNPVTNNNVSVDSLNVDTVKVDSIYVDSIK